MNTEQIPDMGLLSQHNLVKSEKCIPLFTSQSTVVGSLNNDFSFFQLKEPLSTDTMLKPLKMFGFIFVSGGVLNIEINGQMHELKKGTILHITSGSELRLVSESKNVEGYFIIFSSFFFESLHLNILIPEDKSFLNYFKCNNLQDNMLLRVKQLLLLMEEEIIDNKGFYSREILQNLISVLYFDVLNEYSKNNIQKYMTGDANETYRIVRLSQNFINLVKQYSLEQRQVSFYAEKLCISPKYLSSLLKRTTGMTANEWITDIVVNNAKQLLHKSENTIKEVSYALNFSNPSFFGKYFKRVVGISPADYKRTVLVYSTQSIERCNV